MLQNNLQPGDVLLFRPTGFWGRLVAFATGSDYCHAAMYVGDGKVAEMREWIGGRTLPLEAHAGEAIDVFRINFPIIAYTAMEVMIVLLDEPYSFRHGVAAFLYRRIPKWFRKRFRFECDHHGYHCSQAIATAYRLSGLNLCPKLPDWATTPGDLAKSKRLQRIGRMEW
jgi:hypothetical protein